MSLQLKAAKRLLHMAQGKNFADLTVRLWDGSAIEFNRSDARNVAIEFASSAAMRQVVLRPSASTLFALFGSGELRVVDASPLQFLRAFDHVSIASFIKQASRLELIKAVLPFLLPERTSVSTRPFAGDMPQRNRDDRKMVQFHYDISNDFYKLFLDDDMVYSCAYFRNWDNDIDQAQQDKLEHIFRKLRLKPGDRVLDIGCGWGAFPIYAAEHYGALVKGVTLSKAQFDLACERLRARGLSDKVTIENKDFRDLTEREYYDKVASIGMFEHVGRMNHDDYFAKINDLLKPRGL